MADIKSIAVTVNGGSISGLISFAVGETVNINLTVLDPNTGLAKDLTAQAVIMTINCYNTSGIAIPISRQATITNAVAGLATIPIASGDTYISASSICRTGQTAADLWVQDVSGNRQDLGYGTVNITPAVGYPNAPITPLPSQLPLAQGSLNPTQATQLANVVSPTPNLAVAVKNLTPSTLTPLLTVNFASVPDLSSAVKMTYAVECTDGTNAQIQSGTLNANVARTGAGAYTTNVVPTGTTNTVTSGGMTPTFSWTTVGSVATLNVSVTTNLTPNNFHVNYYIDFATHPAAVALA
jgi:hypothetical protein